MIKKCTGCGVVFQYDDPQIEGFVSLEEYEEAKICRRCFRIKNYGDYQVINKSTNDYKMIFENFKNKDNLFLFLCDILTIDETLKELNNFKGKVILVITKKDLLPKSVKEYKLIDYIKKHYDLNVIDIVFVSSVKNYHLDELIRLVRKNKVGNEVYLIGNTNAGKSTLINALIKAYSSNESYITTSALPATTLDVLNVRLADDLTFIDTPGLVSSDNYLTTASPKEVKILTPKTEIKPRTYQMKSNQSLIIGNDYARIDYVGPDKNSFTLYISNDVEVKRININTNDVMRNLKKHEFHLANGRDVVISGLCFCKVVNKADIIVYTRDGVSVCDRCNLI